MAEEPGVGPDLERPSERWHRRHVHHLRVTDAVLLTAAAMLGVLIRFGAGSSSETGGALSVTYWTFGLLITVGWITALQMGRTTDPHVVGEGVEEYRRILRASVMFFGVFAILSVAFKVDSSRGFLAVTLPLGLVLLLIGRKMWRVHLRKQRRSGAMVNNALVIGGVDSATGIARILRDTDAGGARVTGVWVPDRVTVSHEFLDIPDVFIPVFGAGETLATALETAAAETVIVSDTEHLGHHGLKELSWDLEGRGVDLLVAPNVIDVSGSRLQLTTLAKAPFLRIGEPTYSAAAAWPKKLFDRVGAATLILLASPLLLATAIAVKLSSRGPVFYGQERIGRDGEPFAMLKFRSMYQDADGRLKSLLEEQGKSLGPLAKIDADPRVTPVGRYLRRLSLDELPQLFNVLGGTMSLVGPRPQRRFEVDQYDQVAHRRLRVLPGMTGLWQVSGRSDLSWETAVRLDTYYVENWSLTADLVILWRTIRAVVVSAGAY